MSLTVTTLRDRPDLYEEQNQVGSNGWPPFLLNDPVAIRCWSSLIEAFPEYQLVLLDHLETIVAVINTVPLYFDQDWGKLPDGGAEWGIEQSLDDFNSKTAVNCLMGVQVVIAPDFQGRGLSSDSLVQMKRLSLENGLDHVIIPLRPASKHRFPLVAMEDYIDWTRRMVCLTTTGSGSMFAPAAG